MSGPSIFAIAGSAMGAQLVRLNTTASNLANAGTVARTADGAFRALKPIFATVGHGSGASAGVRVAAVTVSPQAPERRHDPTHPLADADGFVHVAAVDPTMELVEMIETSRQYQNNVEVMQTAKTLLSETLRLGRS